MKKQNNEAARSVRLCPVFFCASALAQTIERDSFDVGVEAFNAGNCGEALRIMKKYEKEQPAAAYVVRVCSLMQKNEKKKPFLMTIF